MKKWSIRLTWLVCILAAVGAAVHPEAGLLYENPLACLGVGLIGLGLCREVQRRRQMA